MMAQTTKPPKLPVDEESRALMGNPDLKEALLRAKRARQADLISQEELDRRRPLTPEEVAEADAWLDDLEQQDRTK